jgi:anti-sigma factor ChrR (cupin superfamily)
MKTTRDKTVPALMSHLTPIEPPAGARQRMKDRLFARLHESAGVATIRAGEGEWRSLAPGVSQKMLLAGGGGASFLLRLAPDAVLPAHEHAAYEECLVLEGDIGIGELWLRAGDYQVLVPGTHHGDARSHDGCLLFIRTH